MTEIERKLVASYDPARRRWTVRAKVLLEDAKGERRRADEKLKPTYPTAAKAIAAHDPDPVYVRGDDRDQADAEEEVADHG